jgi:PEP-CTERM motif
LYRSFRPALLGSLLSLTLIAGAHAAVLETQTESFSATGAILTFQQYAGAGTLTNVTLNFSVSSSMFGFFTNDYPISVNATITEGASGTYEVQPGAPAVLLATGSYSPGSANAGETFSNVAPGATRFSGADSASDSSSADLSNPVDLSEFVGTGNFSFLESVYSYQILGYNSGISVGPIFHYSVFTLVDSAIGGSITVTYDGVLPTVASVPEPSTWMTMLIGFAGLGIAGYRRTAIDRRPQPQPVNA